MFKVWEGMAQWAFSHEYDKNELEENLAAIKTQVAGTFANESVLCMCCCQGHCLLICL